MHLLHYSAAILVSGILCMPVLSIVYEDGKLKEDKSCRGPSWKAGLCVSLSKCPKLAGILHEEPFRSERLRFLQYSTCIIDDNDPWVCCPLEYVDRATSPPPATSTLVSKKLKVDIMNHPNAILLPKLPNCGQPAQDGSSRIVGGESPGLGAYPWLALLSVNGPEGWRKFACGGTLISHLYVLTAAHCIKSLPAGFTIPTVRIGEYDKTHDPDCEDLVCAPSIQDIEIEEIITHDNYNLTGQHENDIALIRLSTAPLLGPYVQPVCLPQGSMLERGQHQKKKRAVVAGWGRLKNGEESSILQHVSVPIVPSRRCAQSLLGLKKLPPSMICAGGENGKDSCNGDSGGPLMKNVVNNSSVSFTFQVGIVSMGSAKCGLPFPAIYTKVSHFMVWILDNLRP